MARRYDEIEIIWRNTRILDLDGKCAPARGAFDRDGISDAGAARGDEQVRPRRRQLIAVARE